MRYTLLMLLFMLLVGCQETSQKEEVLIEETVPPQLYFCKQDNCSYHIESLLDQASESIHCAIYDLELRNVVEKLGEKSTEVEVKVVLDKENKVDNFEGEGIKYHTGSALMHNKFCIIDNRKLWTGSMNPTPRGNDLNENHIIVVESAYLAQNYNEEFTELWTGRYGTGEPTEQREIYLNEKKVENLFCPEDQCEQRLVQLLSEAKKSIYFLIFSFTSENVADALLFNREAEIQGIVDSSQAGGKHSQFTRLKDFGINISRDKVKGKLHHKVFIIDNQTIISGSYNPTNSGNRRNDENILILHDSTLALKFSEEYFRLKEKN